MIDGYGRNIDYIRISVTDKCNFRCVYCMPQDEKIRILKEDSLTDEHIKRLCRNFASIGMKKIKITGGEPLLRNNIEELIKAIKSINGIEYVSLTTNGLYLGQKAKALKEAGIDGINVSVDSLNKDLFHKITGSDNYDKVMEGISKVLQYEIPNIKINCVAIKGYNENQLTEIAALAKDNNISVRFIEMMPIGYGKSFGMIKEDEIKEELQRKYGELKICTNNKGNGPAVYYNLNGFKGSIGFISAVSHKFCSECNRVRLTSSGFLKNCLQYDEGIDLKSYLNSEVSDDVLMKIIKDSIFRKPISHIFDCEFKNENIELLTMAQIGG